MVADRVIAIDARELRGPLPPGAMGELLNVARLMALLANDPEAAVWAIRTALGNARLDAALLYDLDGEPAGGYTSG